MLRFHGLLFCVSLYAVLTLLLGVTVASALFIFHVVAFPLIFTYSKAFRRCFIFANFVRWPLNVDYEEPSSRGVHGARNINIEYHSKVDKCRVKIGIWHILPQSVHERLKDKLSQVDKEERHRIMDEELATSKTPVIMYCHGNSTNRAANRRVRMYKLLQKMDFHTVAFDYRGYGDSTNLNPSEHGVVEDSLVVYEWLCNLISRNGHRPPLYVWGHSLGSGITSHLLGNLPELSVQILSRRTPLPWPDGLILEAPFNNLAEEVTNHPLSKPLIWLPYYERVFVAPFRTGPVSFCSDKHLSKVQHLPVLILHAQDDIVVPFAIGQKLYHSIVDSRNSGGACVKLHAFDKSHRLGHKWICTSQDLPTIIGEFLKEHR